jgi:hypothetical protein
MMMNSRPDIHWPHEGAYGAWPWVRAEHVRRKPSFRTTECVPIANASPSQNIPLPVVARRCLRCTTANNCSRHRPTVKAHGMCMRGRGSVVILAPMPR